MSTSSILVSLAVLILIGTVIWRLWSRRRSLPCPAWLHMLVEMDNPVARENRAAAIVERLGLQPGMAVLDAGCGPGRLTVPLARAVGQTGRVLALDLQERMLDRVRAKVRAASLEQVQCRQGALGAGCLPAEQFDRAILVTVLGEIPHQVAALQELAAALKPGGLLSITETTFDPHYVRREAVIRLAAQAGLRETACYGNLLAYTLHLTRA